MPGDDYAVLGCGLCRRTKGIGLWKLPSPKDEAHKKWRKEWLSEITKTREIDQDFKKRLEKDRVFTCEKHFEAEDIELCKYCMVVSLVVFCNYSCVFTLRFWSFYAVFLFTSSILLVFFSINFLRFLMQRLTLLDIILYCSPFRENDQEEAMIWRHPQTTHAEENSWDSEANAET